MFSKISRNLFTTFSNSANKTDRKKKTPKKVQFHFTEEKEITVHIISGTVSAAQKQFLNTDLVAVNLINIFGFNTKII